MSFFYYKPAKAKAPRHVEPKPKADAAIAADRRVLRFFAAARLARRKKDRQGERQAWREMARYLSRYDTSRK
jgi:hypothetical protein